MSHIQQSARSISLHPHVLGFCKSGQGTQCSGSCYLSFIIFMCCQICDAAHGVALNFDVGGHHLPYQG